MKTSLNRILNLRRWIPAVSLSVLCPTCTVLFREALSLSVLALLNRKFTSWRNSTGTIQICVVSVCLSSLSVSHRDAAAVLFLFLSSCEPTWLVFCELQLWFECLFVLNLLEWFIWGIFWMKMASVGYLPRDCRFDYLKCNKNRLHLKRWMVGVEHWSHCVHQGQCFFSAAGNQTFGKVRNFTFDI